jgi:excisionase family DNA binding protein
MPTQRTRHTPDAEVFLYPADVANLLHVTPKTISRWSRAGLLPFQRTLGGHRRYPESAIRELADRLARGEVAS